MQARDFMFKESYDIPKMKDVLLDLKRRLQGHGKRIVKITIPPTGVIAVTRSTGQTVYLAELPLSHVVPPLECPPDDPPPQVPRQQASQRRVSGSARDNKEFESTGTWGADQSNTLAYMAYRRRASVDPHIGTRKSDVPLASRPSVRRKPLRTPYDHSHGTPLQAVPEDTLATPEGESRASSAEGRGGPQHNMRDTIFPTSATTAMPSPPPLRVGSYSVGHHGPLNSDGDCEHQMWEGRYTAGGSRKTPTSSDTNTEEGPTGPPNPPPSLPLPTPRLVRLSARRTCSSDSANSASEQGSPYIAPEGDRELSPRPDLSLPSIPSAPQRPTHSPRRSDYSSLSSTPSKVCKE